MASSPHSRHHSSGGSSAPLMASPLKAARAALNRLVDFAIPPICPTCETMMQSDGGLCGACWRMVPWIEEPVCDRLGLPLSYDLGPGAVSAEALACPPAFDRLRAVCAYEGVAPQLVHALKFNQQRHLARSLGAMMARAGRKLLSEPDTILVPVPLHPFRQIGRRYNQSGLLAEAIASATGGIANHRAVRRVKRTKQQAALSRGDRLRNVDGAFAVGKEGEASLANKRVVLIDDVHTTGATLNALAQTLKRLPPLSRPQSVDALVFATTVLPDRSLSL